MNAPRRDVPSTISYPDDLPITAWRDELIEAIGRHQVVIVAGETGSGKSTQLPKICLELGRGEVGRIGHTQPRRIAARSIAERIAAELGSDLGDLVGYTVRFTDKVAASTAIKVMTDGILLNEIQRDPDLRQYDTIIVDEAHERSLNIDFLLGHLHQLLRRRRDLKVIITSATIDTERFAHHFADAPVVEVAGRTYPVEVRYRPPIDRDSGTPRDQSEAIADAVDELSGEGRGDILVFCSGEREIRDAVDVLRDRQLRHTQVLPLFGRLSAEEQHRIFAPHTGRRIVVATNVAETSLTVPGIRYVIDTGFARISRYNRRTKVQQLPIEPVSRASARQRAGRCGRLGPGIAIRLYDETDYDGRPEYTDPEILRTNLASVMLQMAAANLGDVASFPFIDPPDRRSVRDGAALLEELGAIGDGEPGRRSWLTPIGRRLARIPLDPRLARMLIAADENGSLSEVLTIVSALSIQDPRDRPAGKEEQADQRHRRFQDADSDFLTWLHLWDFISSERRSRTSNQFRRLCREEFLNWRRVREWQDLRAQLTRVARDLGMRSSRSSSPENLVHEALLTGLLSHVGRRDPDGWEYRGPRGTRFAIRPGSTLFKRGPEWIMAGEIVDTGRTWATNVAAVDPDTVERIGRDLVKRTISDPWWDAERGTAVVRQTTTLYGVPLTSDAIVPYDRFDEAGARELFIRNALVADDWTTDHVFADHNRAQVDAVLEIQERERRTDLLAHDDVLAAFFDARIPPDVTSKTRFDAWWRRNADRDPHLLDLGTSDVVDSDAPPPDDEAYPKVWSYGDWDLDLDYAFDTGSDTDGLTVDIPLASLDLIDPRTFEWSIPGLRTDLVTALIRSLPKAHRRRLSPIPDTAADIVARTDPTDGPLVETVARQLTKRSGVVISPDDFDLSRIPRHLRPRYRIVESGDVLAEGDDLDLLRSQFRDEARRTVRGVAHEIERNGITTWDFGSLPATVEITGDRHTITAYPAIVDEDDHVSIRLMATASEQQEASWAGLRRLVLLALPSPTRLSRAVLGKYQPVPTAGSPYADAAEWIEDCVTCAVDDLMARHGRTVTDSDEFSSLVESVKEGLDATLDDVGANARAVLVSLARLNTAMDSIPDVFGDVIDDVEAQIDRIVFPGFISVVGRGRLSDIARYLDAATHRLERLPDDPARDRDRMAVVTALEDEHDRLTEVLIWTEDLVEIAWMLQELRVSLFAQHLGVKGTVSEKRVRTALRQLLET